MLKRSLALLGAACLAAILAAAPASAQRTKLTMYTAIENDQLGPFKQAIEAAVPEVEIVWVRDSTGVITARFLAEKDNPRADVVFGLAVTSLILFEKQGLLETYEPKGASALKPVFRDAAAALHLDRHGRLSLGAVLQHGRRQEEQRRDADLVARHRQARVQGQDHHAASGVVRHRLSHHRGLDADHGREARPGSSWTSCTTTSRSIPTRAPRPACRPRRASAWPASASTCAARARRRKGAPIEIVLPKEGAGWEIEATSIVKGTKNLELAKKVADWGASKGASELYSKYYAIVAEPSVKNTPPNYPPTAEQAMVKNDFGWMAENRDRILAEWSKRYESKAAPKN